MVRRRAVPRGVLGFAIGGMILMMAGLAPAAPGDPFGGDDPGCAPATKDALKCSDGNLKAFAKAYQAVITCHIKQADTAFKTAAPADDEACESTAKTKDVRDTKRRAL